MAGLIEKVMGALGFGDSSEEVNPADYGYNLSKIRGVYENPTFEEAKFNDLIENFVTRDDDVFICTYVKAGTTWTQQIITLLLNGGDQGDKSYGEQCPWLEAATSEMLGPREAPGHTLESIATMDGPRFFKSHATLANLPRGRAPAPGLKVLYVARNPKDTVVSLYHHAKNKPEFGYTGDFKTFVELFLAGACENGSWFSHVLDWWAESQRNPNVLFLKYEDMLADPAAAVARIAEFCALDASPAAVAKTVQNSSMKKMKESAQANALAAFNHLRKGGSGGWKDSFTVATNELFDQIYAKKMEGSGLTFDFGDGVQV
uniref:Sulfotransferase domain-containing protein n=1 Tax=Heterosigma akashiwo TaxID=2829 RepID=A0A6V1XC27_HETAK